MIQQILWGAAAPAALSAICWIAAWLLFRRQPARLAAAGFAAAIGYMGGHLAVGAPACGPDVVSYLFYIAPLGALFGAADSYYNKSRAAFVILRAAAAVASAAAIAWPLRASAPGFDWVVLILQFGALAFVGLHLFARAASRENNILLPVFLLASAAAAAGLFIQYGNAMLAQLAGALAAAAGPTLPLSLLFRNEPFPRGFFHPIILTFAAIACIGHAYGELPLQYSALLLFAPAAAASLLLRGREIPG